VHIPDRVDPEACRKRRFGGGGTLETW
jgi:hypothetical protein